MIDPLSGLAVLGCLLVGYLVGSIPTGYLLVRILKGVDIRTVGSGNIGATNVGRVLGPRYFLIVFLLDALKGSGPTLALPMLAAAWTDASPLVVGVLVALSTVLGHNYTIYLKFRGGKGVATSAGVVAALVPIPFLAAVLGFVIVLAICRYVSLSSILGGACLLVVYFARTPSPFLGDQALLSGTLLLMETLIIVRHRANLGRIARGEEPKIFRRARTNPQAPNDAPSTPTGSITPELLVGLVAAVALVIALAILVWNRSGVGEEAQVGPWAIRIADQDWSGAQRADRVAFFERGRRVALSCPRYQQVLLYEIDEDDRLGTPKTIDLNDQPVALVDLGDRIGILQRPRGDRRHIEPGFLDVFESDGTQSPIPRLVVGCYPDDVARRDDGRIVVLTSGRAEGDSDKPAPRVAVFELLEGSAGWNEVDTYAITTPGDPTRLAVPPAGSRLAIVMGQTERIIVIDRNALDPIEAVVELPRELPRAIRFGPDGDLVSTSLSRPGATWTEFSTTSETLKGTSLHGSEPLADLEGLAHMIEPDSFEVTWIALAPEASELVGVAIRSSEGIATLGSAGRGRAALAIRGRLGLSGVRPIAMDHDPTHRRLAIAHRDGGGITLLTYRRVDRTGTSIDREPVMTAVPEPNRIR